MVLGQNASWIWIGEKKIHSVYIRPRRRDDDTLWRRHDGHGVDTLNPVALFHKVYLRRAKCHRIIISPERVQCIIIIITLYMYLFYDIMYV